MRIVGWVHSSYYLLEWEWDGSQEPMVCEVGWGVGGSYGLVALEEGWGTGPLSRLFQTKRWKIWCVGRIVPFLRFLCLCVLSLQVVCHLDQVSTYFFVPFGVCLPLFYIELMVEV